MSTQRVARPISTAELDRRWRLARDIMARGGVDALVTQNNSDWIGGTVKWFTDVPATNGYPRTVLFFRSDLMTVIEMGPFGGRRALKGEDPDYRGVDDVLTAAPFSSIAYTANYDADLAADALIAKKARKVGLIGPAGMFATFLDRLRERLKGQVEFVDLTEAVDRVKAIKSAEELARLRETATMQDGVFAKVLAAIKPGMRDVELSSLAQYEGQLAGSEQGIFLCSSAPLGQSASFRPRHFQNRTIQKDEHFTLLIENNGPSGFYTEIARAIVLGKASNQLIDTFEAVKEAQAYSVSKIHPGVPAKDVFAAHNAFMAARGLPPEMRLYAHGQGYDMVERPLLRHDETMNIEADTCLAVHPGFDNGECWAVICDNFIVHKDHAPELIHRTPQKVFEVEV
jgi:Xaa-Pro aminopeptidase